MNRKILLCLFGLFLINCQAQKKILPTDYTGKQIVFGSGGGFTGIVNTYILLENGDVYKKRSNETEWQTLPSQSKKETSELFKSFQKLHIDKINSNESGNMYYFLAEKRGNTETKVTWSSGISLPTEIKDFYRYINDKVLSKKK